MLVGALAFRLTAGLAGGRLTDFRGALRSLRDEPFGQVLLAATAVGLLAYGLAAASRRCVFSRGTVSSRS